MRMLAITGVVGFALLAATAARATDSATYVYDSLGRLASVAYANGTTITYDYDLAGNRLGQRVQCGSSGC